MEPPPEGRATTWRRVRPTRAPARSALILATLTMALMGAVAFPTSAAGAVSAASADAVARTVFGAEPAGAGPAATATDDDSQPPAPNAPSIIPQPNSGAEPETPGDPGGWQQTLVFAGILTAGAAVVTLAWRDARRRRAAPGKS